MDLLNQKQKFLYVSVTLSQLGIASMTSMSKEKEKSKAKAFAVFCWNISKLRLYLPVIIWSPPPATLSNFQLVIAQ